jgi:hypothetical protein
LTPELVAQKSWSLVSLVSGEPAMRGLCLAALVLCCGADTVVQGIGGQPKAQLVASQQAGAQAKSLIDDRNWESLFEDLETTLLDAETLVELLVAGYELYDGVNEALFNEDGSYNILGAVAALQESGWLFVEALIDDDDKDDPRNPLVDELKVEWDETFDNLIELPDLVELLLDASGPDYAFRALDLAAFVIVNFGGQVWGEDNLIVAVVDILRVFADTAYEHWEEKGYRDLVVESLDAAIAVLDELAEEFPDAAALNDLHEVLVKVQPRVDDVANWLETFEAQQLANDNEGCYRRRTRLSDTPAAVCFDGFNYNPTTKLCDPEVSHGKECGSQCSTGEGYTGGPCLEVCGDSPYDGWCCKAGLGPSECKEATYFKHPSALGEITDYFQCVTKPEIAEEWTEEVAAKQGEVSCSGAVCGTHAPACDQWGNHPVQVSATCMEACPPGDIVVVDDHKRCEAPCPSGMIEQFMGIAGIGLDVCAVEGEIKNELQLSLELAGLFAFIFDDLLRNTNDLTDDELIDQTLSTTQDFAAILAYNYCPPGAELVG